MRVRFNAFSVTTLKTSTRRFSHCKFFTTIQLFASTFPYFFSLFSFAHFYFFPFLLLLSTISFIFRFHQRPFYSARAHQQFSIGNFWPRFFLLFILSSLMFKKNNYHFRQNKLFMAMKKKKTKNCSHENDRKFFCAHFSAKMSDLRDVTKQFFRLPTIVNLFLYFFFSFHFLCSELSKLQYCINQSDLQRFLRFNGTIFCTAHSAALKF